MTNSCQRSVWMWGLVAAFSATAAVSLSVQLLILPGLFPELHGGSGLLQARDSVLFHWVAKDQAKAIEEDGWAAFQWNPGVEEDLQPAGLSSIFYYFIYPEPWVLIPWNALLHAAAFVLLARLLLPLVGTPRMALVAALPFLLFPSAATWYAQIHKDGLFILGNFVACVGLLVLADGSDGPRSSWKRGAIGAGLIVLGGLMVSSMRPYGIYLLLPSLLVAGLWWIGFCLNQRAVLVRWVFLFLAVLCIFPLGQTKGNWEESKTKSSSEAVAKVPGPMKAEEGAIEDNQPPSGGHFQFLDDWSRKMGLHREGFLILHPNDGSNFDKGVRIESFVDLVSYFPRAVMVGVFAPFPSDWTLMFSTEPEKTVVTFEMLFSYLALVGLVPLILLRKNRWRYIVGLSAISLIPLLIFTVATANLGALYRFRYGFWLILIGLGMCGWVNLVKSLNRSETKKPSRS